MTRSGTPLLLALSNWRRHPSNGWELPAGATLCAMNLAWFLWTELVVLGAAMALLEDVPFSVASCISASTVCAFHNLQPLVGCHWRCQCFVKRVGDLLSNDVCRCSYGIVMGLLALMQAIISCHFFYVLVLWSGSFWPKMLLKRYL